jgi:dTDP-glucose 4,6-dehydratase
LLPEDYDHLVAAGERAWGSLRGAHVFMTGATGIVGIWLLEAIVRANATLGLNVEVTVFARSPGAFAARAPHLTSRHVHFIEGDILQMPALPGGVTHVVHAAAQSWIAGETPSRLATVRTIVDGTRNVLEAAAAARVGRFLYVSTGSIYGRHRTSATGPVTEQERSGPLVTDDNIDHDESKRMAEALCVLYFREYGLPIVIGRLFGVVGPHLPLDAHFAIGNFIRDALRGGPIRVNGDGTPVRSYLYLADAAVWLWTLLAFGRAGEPYNVGSEQALSVAEAARIVAGEVHPTPDVLIAKPASPGSPLSFMVPSTARARHEMGLVTHLELAEAVRRTLLWRRQCEGGTAQSTTAGASATGPRMETNR